MNDRPIYLDHNASTPILPAVLDAMTPYLRDYFGNPSSLHLYGKILREALEKAREQVAQLIECAPEEIVFTSGGTEANNLAIRGGALARPERRRIVTTVIEHPATASPCAYLERQGYSVIRLPIDANGCIDIEAAEQNISRETALVSIAHANSETGTVQPISQISRIAHQNGALVHIDAAQSCGKIDVSVAWKCIDFLSIAGHKLYAPKGVGALFARRGAPISPFVLGADHERGLRPGTENIASIVGLGVACEVARMSLADESERVRLLRDRLWTRLEEKIPGIKMNGASEERLPNTLSVRFPGVFGSALLAACPEIAASTGSACHEGLDKASPVITAMGVPETEALGTVRFSLGRLNNPENIESAAEHIIRTWRTLAGENG